MKFLKSHSQECVNTSKAHADNTNLSICSAYASSEVSPNQAGSYHLCLLYEERINELFEMPSGAAIFLIVMKRNQEDECYSSQG